MNTFNPEPLHIEGNCNVADLSDADCNRLVSVGGFVYAGNSHNLSFPALQSVDYLYAGDSNGLSMPNLQSCTDIYAYNATGLTIPAELAVEHNLPHICLSDATLKAIASLADQPKQTTQPRIKA